MKKILLLAGLAIAAFASCTDSNSVPSASRFNVTMTDAPGAYDFLLLSVKEIQVLTSEGNFSMEVDPEPFDILQFRMGKDTLLASQDIPAGRLQEIRVVLNDTGNQIGIDGEVFDLKVPSGQASGLKIKVQDTIVANIAYTLKLDFDAARSIVKAGNGKYLLKPVIRAIPNSVTGAITGMISPAEASPEILAIAGSDTLGTVTDSLGRFYFPGIPAGSYQVQVNPVSPYLPQTIEDVTVVNGSVKNLGTISLTQ